MRPAVQDKKFHRIIEFDLTKKAVHTSILEPLADIMGKIVSSKTYNST